MLLGVSSADIKNSLLNSFFQHVFTYLKTVTVSLLSLFFSIILVLAPIMFSKAPITFGLRSGKQMSNAKALYIKTG